MVGGECSSERLITSGVPQGTVLGPTLFFIFINFVAEGVGCEWRAFADDLKLYLPITDLNDSASSLQRDLCAVKTVGMPWNLQLNISKCKSMRFGGRSERLS